MNALFITAGQNATPYVEASPLNQIRGEVSARLTLPGILLKVRARTSYAPGCWD